MAYGQIQNTDVKVDVGRRVKACSSTLRKAE